MGNNKKKQSEYRRIASGKNAPPLRQAPTGLVTRELKVRTRDEDAAPVARPPSAPYNSNGKGPDKKFRGVNTFPGEYQELQAMYYGTHPCMSDRFLMGDCDIATHISFDMFSLYYKVSASYMRRNVQEKLASSALFTYNSGMPGETRSHLVLEPHIFYRRCVVWLNAGHSRTQVRTVLAGLASVNTRASTILDMRYHVKFTDKQGKEIEYRKDPPNRYPYTIDQRHAGLYRYLVANHRDNLLPRTDYWTPRGPRIRYMLHSRRSDKDMPLGYREVVQFGDQSHAIQDYSPQLWYDWYTRTYPKTNPRVRSQLNGANGEYTCKDDVNGHMPILTIAQIAAIIIISSTEGPTAAWTYVNSIAIEQTGAAFVVFSSLNGANGEATNSDDVVARAQAQRDDRDRVVRLGGGLDGALAQLEHANGPVRPHIQRGGRDRIGNHSCRVCQGVWPNGHLLQAHLDLVPAHRLQHVNQIRAGARPAPLAQPELAIIPELPVRIPAPVADVPPVHPAPRAFEPAIVHHNDLPADIGLVQQGVADLLPPGGDVPVHINIDPIAFNAFLRQQIVNSVIPDVVPLPEPVVAHTLYWDRYMEYAGTRPTAIVSPFYSMLKRLIGHMLPMWQGDDGVALECGMKYKTTVYVLQSEFDLLYGLCRGRNVHNTALANGIEHTAQQNNIAGPVVPWLVFQALLFNSRRTMGAGINARIMYLVSLNCTAHTQSQERPLAYYMSQMCRALSIVVTGCSVGPAVLLAWHLKPEISTLCWTITQSLLAICRSAGLSFPVKSSFTTAPPPTSMSHASGSTLISLTQTLFRLYSVAHASLTLSGVTLMYMASTQYLLPDLPIPPAVIVVATPFAVLLRGAQAAGGWLIADLYDGAPALRQTMDRLRIALHLEWQRIRGHFWGDQRRH